MDSGNQKNIDRIILGIDPGTTATGYAVVRVAKAKPQLIVMGVISLTGVGDHYSKLGRIFERVSQLVEEYHPNELAIEAPFFGKNVQSMLKLGRAQGVAMAAALVRGISITEYAPRKVKQSITGQGAASKEQVAGILAHTLKQPLQAERLDATDALAVAMCHFYQTSSPFISKVGGARTWEDFVKNNPNKLK